MLYWLTFLQALPTPELPAPPRTQTKATVLVESPPIVMGNLGGLLFFPGVIAGIVILLLLSIWAYTRVYVITPNNEAFVRTGGIFVKKKTVILNGGCIALPGFHELTRVPLREISIDVERTGKLAVRTQDYLRADMRVTFYVCINATEEDVLTAAARLSQNNRITPEDIKNALEKRADDAIRAAAKHKSLAEIDSDKLGFAQEVLNLMQQDLQKVGLTLNNIAISEVQESDTYDENNFFDAQGVRLRTETIQRSIQQKREVELSTRVAIEQKELDAQKRSLQIEEEKEAALLSQRLKVEALKAQREREIEEAKAAEAAAIQRAKLLQAQAVEEEEIRKRLAIQQKEIEASIELEEKNKLLKVTQAQQQQEAEIAEISRQQQVEANRLQAQVAIAESERQARLAQEDVAIAVATKKKESLIAEAERARAESAVTTAIEVEKADRQKNLAIIAAEREAAEKRVLEQNVVEIDAFRRRRQAEIAQQAAELEAEAIRTLAAANRDKALAEAEGMEAMLAAKNVISNANLTAQVITALWPELAPQLPQVLEALAPQPGVIGDAKIYTFANGGTPADLNKLLLSTSGLALINALFEEGKLGQLLAQIKSLLQENTSHS
ncbi:MULTISPECIES: SPFH domain-containing protein [unclassified Thermosynechococcus]|uniref:flotillin family protein n=1 Tax=unclassified Thermosynechococcus TaxID=2622553 RepID=UPI002873BF90|nr:MULTISPECIES: SPFH domain-containing protein [unclassified Thermosynechococcus]WNC32422.1 SPFH domain-containing protein [Thermosynechococcus sp. PKX95]WNC34952.1 SPFH domain-containing protein [Thermosynechococcus sp. PKX91]WNC37468.1 SPFH domain-containing protein [Thermosynechococcus sp. WL11]WNC39990.1 SPFH domain-containing protein [Thermosynechococcus sp. WL17]WNC42510.1 SPFH domain-containing protein [Thermosynechococcus sp. WL15]